MGWLWWDYGLVMVFHQLTPCALETGSIEFSNYSLQYNYSLKGVVLCA